MGKLNGITTLTLGLLFLIVGIIIYFVDKNNGKETIDVSNAFVLGLGTIVTIAGIVKWIQEKRSQ